MDDTIDTCRSVNFLSSTIYLDETDDDIFQIDQSIPLTSTETVDSFSILTVVTDTNFSDSKESLKEELKN